MRTAFWTVSIALSALPACAPGMIESGDASHDARVRDAGRVPPSDGAARDVLYLYPDDAAGAPDVNIVPVVSSDAGAPDTAVAPPTDSGPPSCTTVTCTARAMCDATTGTCVCGPGFTGDGTTCTAVDPGNPATRTRDEMCSRWRSDRVLTATQVWSQPSAMCDPGTIDPAALADGMRILNLYRWLSGVAPAMVDPSFAAGEQSCALMESLNAPPLSHFPPTTWTCYDAQGADAAGSSNLAWGGAMSPAASVDLYLDESGSELGHRRWCLYPGLTGTYFGAAPSASCMHSFGFGDASNPAWVAYPNPGFAPIENFGVWSVQSGVLEVDASGVTVEVRDTSTGDVMPTTPVSASNGYGGAAIAWQPNGWDVAADTTYQVTLSNLPDGSTITYTTTPVNCP